MADILTEILAHKRAETAARMRQTPLPEMRERAKKAPPPRPFAAALRDAVAGNGRYPVIAEIKRKSPSKGELCADFDAARIAKGYESGGAACLSVLTDEKYFGGGEADLKAARKACNLPVLRKDFIILEEDERGKGISQITEWQIYESRAMGADAILLIVAAWRAMPSNKDAHFWECMREALECAINLGMSVLVELHDREEMKSIFELLSHLSVVIDVPTQKIEKDSKEDVLLGINNRDLKTFKTDLQTTVDLAKIKQERDEQNQGKEISLLISESGIKSAADIKRLKEAGADAFLIGESLVNNPEDGLRELFADA